MDIVETVVRESRHAVRTLRRSPSFSLIAILTLGIGLGASTTIFTLLDRVALRPLPYPNAERLIHIGTLWPKVKAGEEYGISRGQYFYFKQHSQALADILFYDRDVMVVPGDGDHPAERVPELDVSAGTFKLLGIRPQIGRLFTVEDELNPEGDPRVAVLSDGYWRRRFGGDPRVIGKRIPYGTRTIEIIGVLPPNASVPDAKADIWIRNHLDPRDKPQNNHTHSGVALLKPGVTVAAALADLRRLQQQMQADYPDVYRPGFAESTGFLVNVTSLRDRIVGGTIVRALWLLFAAVGFVLLIAAANVANLFLVRIDARRREAALRAALGADRSHVAAHYLTESLLVTLLAAVAAIVVAASLLHVVLAIAPHTLPRLDEVSINWRGVVFCLGTALLFGVVFGLLPLSAASRVDIAMLREGGRGLIGSPARDLARRGLVLSQVALAVVLLSSAALMAKSFNRLRNVRPGFDPVGVSSMSISVPVVRYPKSNDVAAFWRELTRRVEAVPGVVRTGASGSLPLADEGGCSYVITDVVDADKERANCMPMTMVTPGYFEAMGIKVRGATPTWAEVEAGTGPTVVTASFARRFWGDEKVIGRGVKMYNPKIPFFTIVGVAEDVRGLGLQEPPVQEVFFPMIGPPGSEAWSPFRFMHFVVRAPSLGHAAVVTRVRQILEQIDPQIPLADVLPMETVVAQSMASTSFTMLLLLIAAGIALVLSAVGIYGVISYIVGQRRAEIGIRMALGAQAAEVSRMIVGQSLALATAGVAVGVLVALGVTRFLRTLLFEVSPTDPVVLGGTCVILLLTTIVASFGPTRRAAKVDPVEAMR